ncbi:Stk1 family PASTA domain-containing Ser/Thr kinase [Nocardioides marmotae]|uniref:Stk1 family PASTA domain-containing Ser/Thr kinase n=1 Tax=Nocardioides marmotae TaxID=2663857 RepID=UPI0016599985|nr:Stk1 family PASTA domain-containing Ser/Thr kinase [Nocardioides marmotae]MBC9732118.1 Stk1 family PASTA domain-containing Ser/Thr kinase [Nocardioides marmotae]
MTSDRHARSGADEPSTDPSPRWDGRRLEGRLLDGRYRVGPRIARGGMASVYEATDIRLDRTVAVKVMHPGLGDDEEFAARFVREARAAARLSHPNVVAVHDQGADDGVVFLAMELVPGHTLRDVIAKESPMPPARALALLEPVLSALAAAHRAGLVHRDVKPENVLIATDPDTGTSRVKVADFGLAKAVSADTQHTATGGVLIGTVSYLAPELVVDGRADARADVYAAGVLLFELLTGRKPHEGESPIQVAYKHVHEDVPLPSTLVPGLPAYVDALVARATARDRGQRAADAGVLLHQLRRVATAVTTGVREDPDLVADLMPRPPAPDTDPVTGVTGAGDTSEHTQLLRTAEVPPAVQRAEQPGRPGRTDTAADPWDEDEMAALLAPSTAAITAGPAAPEPTRTVPVGATPAPRRTRRSRRGLLALVLALLLATGIGAGAWWFGVARWTTTPGVLGLDRAAAVERLEAAGLEAEIGPRAFSRTVPAGEVMSTDPAPGDRVLDGGTVTVTISKGEELYDVPKLRGMTEDEAQDALAELKLEFGGSTQRWSEDVPQGVVLASDPKPGTTLRPGSVVDLVVSKGRKPIKVKDWTGEDADTARQRMEAQGLVVEVTGEEHSDEVAEGDVISQDPVGATLFKGDTVELVVSLGPELVPVPNVRASGVDAAREELEALGFEVETRKAAGYLGLGYVFSQDPGSGEMVPKGTTITLTLI